jgi:ferritin-like metal-binding protein YciE
LARAKNKKPPFDVKSFLSTMDGGRTVTSHRKNEKIFSQGAPALDAGLLAAAQAVEHYEIARYGSLATWAKELGLNQSVKLLQTTLGEEKKTDQTLTQLAESQVNQHGQQAA